MITTIFSTEEDIVLQLFNLDKKIKRASPAVLHHAVTTTCAYSALPWLPNRNLRHGVMDTCPGRDILLLEALHTRSEPV
jgi:hypothetical protein